MGGWVAGWVGPRLPAAAGAPGQQHAVPAGPPGQALRLHGGIPPPACWHQHATTQRAPSPPSPLPACLQRGGGGTNILAAHAGSPLLLLGLLLVYNPALWLCSYTLYPRLVMSSNFVSLPLLALLPVRW